eukprot:38370-Amphidinium_carterae.1
MCRAQSFALASKSCETVKGCQHSRHGRNKTRDSLNPKLPAASMTGRVKVTPSNRRVKVKMHKAALNLEPRASQAVRTTTE